MIRRRGRLLAPRRDPGALALALALLALAVLVLVLAVILGA